jgi:phage gpG-like protein
MNPDGTMTIEELRDAVGKIAKPDPELIHRTIKEFAPVFEARVLRHFEAESSLPAGNQWPPLAIGSLLAAVTRGRRRGQGGKILQRTGALMRSVTHSVLGLSVTIGSPVKYARAHDQGFAGSVPQTVKAHTRRGGRGRKAASVAAFNRVINQNIPRRQFLAFQEEDVLRLLGLIWQRSLEAAAHA